MPCKRKRSSAVASTAASPLVSTPAQVHVNPFTRRWSAINRYVVLDALARLRQMKLKKLTIRSVLSSSFDICNWKRVTTSRRVRPANSSSPKRKNERSSPKAIRFRRDCHWPSRRKSHSRKSAGKSKTKWVTPTIMKKQKRKYNFSIEKNNLIIFDTPRRNRSLHKKADEKRRSTWTNWSDRLKCLCRRTAASRSASKRSKTPMPISWVNWRKCRRWSIVRRPIWSAHRRSLVVCTGCSVGDDNNRGAGVSGLWIRETDGQASPNRTLK